MLHRTAPSAVRSLLWGYWVLGWGHKRRYMSSVRLTGLCIAAWMPISFARCSSSHRHIQNAKCVNAFSTPMAPFIRTSVGMWIILQEKGVHQIRRRMGNDYNFHQPSSWSSVLFCSFLCCYLTEVELCPSFVFSFASFCSIAAEWLYWWEWHYPYGTTDGGEGSPFAPQSLPELEHPIKYPVGLVCCYLCLQALLIIRQLPGSN